MGEPTINYEDLTEEQKARLKAAKSPEEILELAQEEGYELSIDDLDQATGGGKKWNECHQDTVSGPY